MKKIEMIGKRFGRLTVIAEGAKHPSRQRTWICQCDCGQITPPILGYNLRKGLTKSCGCLKLERLVERSTMHGKSQTRIYHIYSNMIQRCSNPKVERFSHYGGRGITVCDEWKNSFQAFYDWAMANGYADNLTIDRIDVDGNYEPSNCRWATPTEQCNNRSHQILVEINGVTKTIAQLSKESGIPYRTIHERHIKGVSGEDLIKKQ